jgi:hypothetical protein
MTRSSGMMWRPDPSLVPRAWIPIQVASIPLTVRKTEGSRSRGGKGRHEELCSASGGDRLGGTGDGGVRDGSDAGGELGAMR